MDAGGDSKADSIAPIAETLANPKRAIPDSLESPVSFVAYALASAVQLNQSE